MGQHLYMEKKAGKSIWFCILFVKLPSYMLYFICLTYQMSVETESNCNVLYLYMYMVQSGAGVGNCFIVEGSISFNCNPSCGSWWKYHFSCNRIRLHSKSFSKKNFKRALICKKLATVYLIVSKNTNNWLIAQLNYQWLRCTCLLLETIERLICSQYGYKTYLHIL